MKKFITLAAFILLMMPAMAQMWVTVTGYVTDSATGTGIPNYPVTISSDSTAGFVYYNTVYTTSNGYYADSIWATTGWGLLYVRVWDCNQVMHQDTCNFAMGNTFFIKNFSICYSNTPNCNAEFTWNVSPPLTVYFTDLSTNPGGIWYWWFGDGETSTQQNPVHTYALPGNYLVQLIIGDSTICRDYVAHTVVVQDSMGGGCQAQFTWYPDSIPAQGNAIQFLDQSSGTPTSWLWDFGDGSPMSTEQNPMHIYPGVNLSYYVCLTIQCQGVTSTWCAEVTVTNPVNCTSYFTFQQANLNVSYTGYMLYGQPATYSWNFGDGQTGTGQNATHQYAAAGIYYVSLTTTTTDSMACTYTTSQSVMVGDSGQFHQVYGQVFAGNFPLGFGIAMIIGVDTAQNYVPFVDVTTIDSMGVYYFPMVPNGQYVVLAIPLDSGIYLPTYYGDVLYWEDATLIILGEPVNPYDIHLIPAGDMTPGPGNINGQINTGLFDNSEAAAGMVDKIMMYIMDENQIVLSYDQVDAGGGFAFPQIGYGSYFLHAELAGCTSDLILVDVTEQNPDVNVVLTYSSGSVLGMNDSKAELNAGAVYPNPVSHEANININTDRATILTAILYDLTGREVLRMSKQVPAGNNRLTIPVNSINSGVYLVRLTSDEGVSVVKKIVISR